MAGNIKSFDTVEKAQAAIGVGGHDEEVIAESVFCRGQVTAYDGLGGMFSLTDTGPADGVNIFAVTNHDGTASGSLFLRRMLDIDQPLKLGRVTGNIVANTIVNIDWDLDTSWPARPAEFAAVGTITFITHHDFDYYRARELRFSFSSEGGVLNAANTDYNDSDLTALVGTAGTPLLPTIDTVTVSGTSVRLTISLDPSANDSLNYSATARIDDFAAGDT